MYREQDFANSERSMSNIVHHKSYSSSFDPGSITTPQKIPAMNNEYLQAMHTDLTKASTVISKLKKEKKSLQLTLDSTIESYNTLKDKYKELQKTLTALASQNKVLETKAKQLDFAFSKYQDAVKVSQCKDEKIKDLQLKCDYYENLRNSQTDDNMWKQLWQANEVLKEELETSRNQTSTKDLENSPLASDIVFHGLLFLENLQKNQDFLIAFKQHAKHINKYKEFLLTGQWDEALLIILKFAEEIVQNKSKAPKLFDTELGQKPTHFDIILAQNNLQAYKSVISSSPVSPIYRQSPNSPLSEFSLLAKDTDKLTMDQQFDSHNDRIAILNEQIFNTMESGKRILSTPPSRSLKSACSLNNPNEYFSIDKKLENAERKITTETTMDEFLLKETENSDHEKGFQSPVNIGKKLIRPKPLTSVKINRLGHKSNIQTPYTVPKSPSSTLESCKPNLEIPLRNRLYKAK
ncbi:unnamed protein product [Blepharisma stoltei]|uniref:Uncharacterized protein n=1 Tax=Blepharisma stoltei TaxID=1481888 RepID=A0AAU9KFE3_9CILI|nr:unnamed protein product [Blepharisma stoltei]